MKVKASTFADAQDVAAFHRWHRRYVDMGMSDLEATSAAFKKGDNGIGCWGDDCASDKFLRCALPPEDYLARWGSKANARLKRVVVRVGSKSFVGELADRMPSRANIKNGCGLDLNPGFQKAFGITPPWTGVAEWHWADDVSREVAVAEPAPAWWRRLFG